MKVLVASSNADKISATKRAFEQAMNPASLEIEGINTDSGIPSGQPYGMQGTYQGALTRLEHLLSKASEYDYLVSIENGIETLTSDSQTSYLDFPVVVIFCCETKTYQVQFGQSRPIPFEAMRQMKVNSVKGIGKWCEQWYMEHNLYTSRQDIIYRALLIALHCF